MTVTVRPEQDLAGVATTGAGGGIIDGGAEGHRLMTRTSGVLAIIGHGVRVAARTEDLAMFHLAF